MTLKCVEVVDGLSVILQQVVLPCNDPPAIHIVLKRDNNTLIDKIVSESQEFPIVQGLVSVNVTRDQLDGAIGIQVCI